MEAFHSGREAKEFLISELVAQAQRENLPLSEVERKMLYFTESGWTLPDILKVSQDFDREYDQVKYEQKIAKLVTKADRRIRKGSPDSYDKWWAAIRFLQREDHYITVIIRRAGLRPRGDRLRLFATAFGFVAFIFGWVFLSIKYNIPAPSRGNLGVFIWAVVAALTVVYTLLRLTLGASRTDALTSTALEKLVRITNRLCGTG
jgi:hypothetical protein